VSELRVRRARMWIIAAIGLALSAVATFFGWANFRTRRAHARFTSADVIVALEEFVSSDAQSHDTWDLFLTWPIDDPYLESIRLRCQSLARSDAEPAAKDTVHATLTEMRDRI
jgi:hypothetical protein